MTYGFCGRKWLTCPGGAIALGATGSAPARRLGSEIRPTCQSCRNIRPPAARTDVDCAVSYYGVGMDANADEAVKVNVPIVFHMAELDEYAPRCRVVAQRVTQVAQRRHAGPGSR